MMSLDLHTCVKNAIGNVNKFEQIQLYLPQIRNTKGKIETMYSDAIAQNVHIQNEKYSQDLSDNAPKGTKECIVYLSRNAKIHSYINAIFTRKSKGYWRIHEIIEESEKWLKCLAIEQKA